MKRIIATTATIALSVFLGTAAFADAPITTTDEARARAGQAQYRTVFSPTGPSQNEERRALTTTDEIRAAAGRDQYRAAFVPRRAAPAKPLAWLTTTDEVRAAIGRAQYREARPEQASPRRHEVAAAR
ncbi:MAG: hypothetical protein MJE77_41855 [Proteobacteria bacterium]|nr:hypothetical protein [Pseudomonadota bacterium]